MRYSPARARPRTSGRASAATSNGSPATRRTTLRPRRGRPAPDGEAIDMRSPVMVAAVCAAAVGLASYAAAQRGARGAQPPPPPDLIKPLVDRLELARYKATIKGLTGFGDRRQGTDRNRSAVDWIEAQLKSYGCANV